MTSHRGSEALRYRNHEGKKDHARPRRATREHRLLNEDRRFKGGRQSTSPARPARYFEAVAINPVSSKGRLASRSCRRAMPVAQKDRTPELELELSGSACM